jgi:hypothetical protein
VDAQTNVISAINIADEISAPIFPAVHRSLHALFGLSRESIRDDPDDVRNAKVCIFNNGNLLIESPIAIQFQGKKRTRAIMKYGIVPIPAPGSLDIVLFFDNDVEMARWPIIVVQTGNQNVQQIPA